MVFRAIARPAASAFRNGARVRVNPALCRCVHTEAPGKSGRFVPLQLLVLGAMPLFAGYLIGKSSTDVPGQVKLSQVEFADKKHMLQVSSPSPARISHELIEV